MAEEVGAAYVSLIPSARGFSKIAQRELNKELRGNRTPTIRVRPEVEVDEFSRTINAQLSGAGQRVTIPVDVEINANQIAREMIRVSARERVSVDADVDTADLLSDTRRAVRFVQATRPNIEVETDVDHDRLRRLLTSGGSAATEGGSFLGKLFNSGFEASITNPVIGIPVLIAGILSLPVLSAAVAAATLAGAGLGVIFAGAFALRADPGLKTSAAGFMSTINTVFAEAAEPLKGPLTEALGILSQAVVDIGPELRTMFEGIAPYIPVLAEGVAGFLKAFTPGLVDAVVRSGPVLEQLAWALPDLGDAIGDFLSDMAEVAPEAGMFIGMLIRGTGDLIRVFGGLIKAGALAFRVLVNGFDLVKQAFGLLSTQARVVVAVLTGKFNEARLGVYKFIDAAIALFRRLASFLPESIKSAAGSVVREIGRLSNRILSAVSGFGSLLYNAGRRVIQGLIDGIFSKISGVGSAIGAAAQKVRDFWPFSPAKEGPLSGHGSLFYAGQNLVGDLTRGMGKGLPAVRSASSQLAGAIGFGASASALAPVGTAGAELGWRPGATGDPILDALRGLISAKYYGDPVKALASR